IERWGNPDKSPDNYVFPFLTGYETPIEQKKRIQDVTRRINKRLKVIGDKYIYGKAFIRQCSQTEWCQHCLYFGELRTFGLEND
ncbi:hypothetical protein EZS27_025498, partial [termite gut metagenome]